MLTELRKLLQKLKESKEGKIQVEITTPLLMSLEMSIEILESYERNNRYE